MSETRVIKKYPNRRLYDTAESRYITLADVQKLVRAGGEFKGVDSQSGDDITRGILIQIIADQESGGAPLFTTEMLTRFVRFYDEAVHDVFSSYLDQSLRAFGEQQKLLQQQFSEVLGARAVRDMAELTRRNLDLWREMQEGFLKAAGVGGRKKDPEED
jgi:polyhydroxyalkanoate synthesis repressor PhaR